MDFNRIKFKNEIYSLVEKEIEIVMNGLNVYKFLCKKKIFFYISLYKRTRRYSLVGRLT